VANGKRRKQTIFSMNNGDEVIPGDAKLMNHATEYYKSLFGLGYGNTFELDVDLWTEDLITPFWEDEVKKALYMMVGL
jgi:hypothetical protein